MIVDQVLEETLGLQKFPEHRNEFLLSFGLFLFVHQVAAPWLCEKYFPVAYGTKNNRTKNAWAIHVVSQVHVMLIIPLAFHCLKLESLNQDRVHGWHPNVGTLHAISCGYFLWDVLDAVINYTDFGFVVHGLACFLIYAGSFKPFIAYFGCRCLLWEVSTFFLNIHWFLDKTGRTGGKFQLANAAMLLASFLGARIIYGGHVSLQFFNVLYQIRNHIPPSYLLIYGGGNIALQGLNIFWFSKMIAAIQRRFPKETSPKHHTIDKTH